MDVWKILIVVKFWWGTDFLWWWGIVCENIFIFFVWKFLVMWVFVKEIDELNFCVAEPQESRQSPNVEKCMGNIVF